MLISSVTKFSLVEFPWLTSCIIFTPWCNFRCNYCHNPEFVRWDLIAKNSNNLISQTAFFNFLQTRVWLLDWVSICWGEPTLQKWLVEFCQKVKSMWFKVKLDTNWTNPELLQELFSLKLLDYIAMDIKTNIINYDKIVWVKAAFDFQKSIEIIRNSWVDYEFRTTLIKWFHEEEDILDIVKNMIFKAKKYCLQNFKPTKLLDENFTWESFTQKELENFKKIVWDNVLNCEIRN